VFTSRAGIKHATHDAAWKQVKKMSERQFGAFLLLYLTNFKRPFLAGAALNAYERQMKFRNEVIHQGRFPSGKETKHYAKQVFELIRDTRQALKDLDAETVQEIEVRHLFRGHAAVKAKAGAPKADKDGLYRGAGTAAFPVMLNPMAKDAPGDFETRLAHSTENLWLWGFPSELAKRSGIA
jgi:hypothetical protein